MNVIQIMRQAQFEVDTVRAGNVLSGMWTAEEVLSACNTAMDRTARLLRLAGSDILTKRMRSNEGASDLISEVYSPSVSLRIQAGVFEYTLPPDFVRVAAIRPLSTATGFTNVRFVPSAYHLDSWTDDRTLADGEVGSAQNTDMTFQYLIQGARTMRLAPTPQDTFDIEFAYHYRAPRLRYYSTGTVQRSNGAVGVTGSGTAWLGYGLRAPAELMVGVTSLTGVTLDSYYPVISSFTTDTSLVLARASTTTDAVGQNYTIAMVPQLPEEHHAWLAQMVAATMLRKVDVDLSMKMQSDLATQLLEQVTPEITLRQLQASLVADAFELWR